MTRGRGGSGAKESEIRSYVQYTFLSSVIWSEISFYGDVSAAEP